MKREIIPYNPKLKSLAKKLRQNMTLSEVLLWDELKQKKINGHDFDRQKPLSEFIVDFYCKDLKLAIEIDGKSHDHEDAFKADKERQTALEKLGISFLRFDDLEVKNNIGNVIRTIEYWIEEYKEKKDNEPIPTPLKGQDSAKEQQSTNLNQPKLPKEWLFPSSERSDASELGVGSLESLLELAKKAALAAGSEIIKIYKSDDFSVESKADDSPLTRADKAAHNKIVSFLEKTGIPILSEEGRNIPFKERSQWEYFWMVDPLDGTKEFIKRNGEFTVNIALINSGFPVLGVVYPPILGELYWGLKDKGAYKEVNGDIESLEVSKCSLSDPGLKVVASRSHMSDQTKEFVDSLKAPEVVSKGSSLKFLLVASGEADVYPRFGPTMEWDTAAAHAIVSEAGGSVVKEDETTPLSYNKDNLLNPSFIVLPFQ